MSDIAALRDELESWRQRAEWAEARLASVSGTERQELARATAEAQREACAKACEMSDIFRESVFSKVCRETPLVTESKR